MKMIGQYEIYKEDEYKSIGGNVVLGEVRESMASHTSGIASEDNIPPVHS